MEDLFWSEAAEGNEAMSTIKTPVHHAIVRRLTFQCWVLGGFTNST